VTAPPRDATFGALVGRAAPGLSVRALRASVVAPSETTVHCYVPKPWANRPRRVGSAAVLFPSNTSPSPLLSVFLSVRRVKHSPSTHV